MDFGYQLSTKYLDSTLKIANTVVSKLYFLLGDDNREARKWASFVNQLIPLLSISREWMEKLVNSFRVHKVDRYDTQLEILGVSCVIGIILWHMEKGIHVSNQKQNNKAIKFNSNLHNKYTGLFRRKLPVLWALMDDLN